MPQSKVKVVVRTRPTANFAHDCVTLGKDQKTVDIGNFREVDPHDGVNNQTDSWTFKVDQILDNASQTTMFDECALPVLHDVVDGFNGTILCYGQTGAGKTYTMSGGQTNFQQRGVIPRTIGELFNIIQEKPETQFTVKVGYLEIYNETIYDLLDASPVDKDMQIQEDNQGNISVRGMTQKICASEEDALTFFFDGEANRSIAEHSLNSRSTRSHCIFQIVVESKSRIASSEKVLISKLNLVDLAGSERVKKTESKGMTLKEAQYINKSLTFLEQVVVGLNEKQRHHIPYRQSRLTNVLKDSLGGNCKTLMIANVWLERSHMEETLSTLRFAQRMMRVSNEATINEHVDSNLLLRRYEREIRELKQELQMHDTLNNRGFVNYEPYSEQEKADLNKTVRQYLKNEIEEIDIQNLRQVREIFVQFKVIMSQMESDVEDRLRKEYILSAKGPEEEQEGKTSANGAGPGGEDGVGDVDTSGGFGVGKAPPGAKPAKKVWKDKPSGDTSRPITAASRESTAAGNNEAAPPSQPVDEFVKETERRPDKHRSYDDYKKDAGAPLNDAVKRAQSDIVSHKKKIKELSTQVNVHKQQIDALQFKINTKRQKRLESENQQGDEDVIDEEEFQFIRQMKDEKRLYRESFEALKNEKKAAAEAERSLSTNREQLLRDFSEWYVNTYGEDDSEDEERQQLGTPATGSMRSEFGFAPNETKDDEEELMDDGEKFELLQMQKMIKDDPDAASFYKARKETLFKKKHTPQQKKIEGYDQKFQAQRKRTQEKYAEKYNL